MKTYPCDDWRKDQYYERTGGSKDGGVGGSPSQKAQIVSRIAGLGGGGGGRVNFFKTVFFFFRGGKRVQKRDPICHPTRRGPRDTEMGMGKRRGGGRV